MRSGGLKILDDLALEAIIKYIRSIEAKYDCTFNIALNSENIKLETDKIIWKVIEHSAIGGVELDYGFGDIIDSNIGIITSRKIPIDSDIMVIAVPKKSDSIFKNYAYNNYVTEFIKEDSNGLQK